MTHLTFDLNKGTFYGRAYTKRDFVFNVIFDTGCSNTFMNISYLSHLLDVPINRLIAILRLRYNESSKSRGCTANSSTTLNIVVKLKNIYINEVLFDNFYTCVDCTNIISNSDINDIIKIEKSKTPVALLGLDFINSFLSVSKVGPRIYCNDFDFEYYNKYWAYYFRSPADLSNLYCLLQDNIKLILEDEGFKSIDNTLVDNIYNTLPESVKNTDSLDLNELRSCIKFYLSLQN